MYNRNIGPDALINVYKLINKAGNYCIALSLFSFDKYCNKCCTWTAVFIAISALRCSVYLRVAFIHGNTMYSSGSAVGTSSFPVSDSVKNSLFGCKH